MKDLMPKTKEKKVAIQKKKNSSLQTVNLDSHF